MGNDLVQKLREWRFQKSMDENVELYMIMQNVTLEEIAEKKPRSKAEFVDIKGFGEKKYQKYATEILSVIDGEWEPISLFSPPPETSFDMREVPVLEREILSVGRFLDQVNQAIRPIEVFVQGEVTSIDIRKHLYFSIKDKTDKNLLHCFMWENDFEMAHVELQEGLEVILYGYAEIYKPQGKMTFRVSSIELVGEGALKRAYEILKKKLEAEGIFEPARKKPLPTYPVRIGVITSKQGAVIHDFLTNIGKHGYQIQLYDSRVEGALAIKELVKAIHYFKTAPIDLLVVIRGGGSLESLQAFNNETLIRSILDYPVPVICGIGHDKDEPLFCLAADVSVSTPTAVTREINRSWETAVQKVDYYHSNLVMRFSSSLLQTREMTEKIERLGKTYWLRLKLTGNHLQQLSSHFLSKIGFTIKQLEKEVNHQADSLCKHFRSNLEAIHSTVSQVEKALEVNNPERQLKLGYSLLYSKEKVIKSVDQIKPGSPLTIELSDGHITSTAEEVIKRSDDGND